MPALISFVRALLLVPALLGSATAQADAHAPPPASGKTPTRPVLEGQLNMNTATAEQWDLLPGIGPATAARILAHRAKHPFKHPTQLMRVKGIGRKTYDALKPYLVVSGETTLRMASS